jgi:hypothetical protein
MLLVIKFNAQRASEALIFTLKTTGPGLGKKV